jgi:hypothetical protein
MNATCSSVTVVQNKFCLVVDKTSPKNAIYASRIQNAIEYKIASRLMSNFSTLIVGRKRMPIQSLEIHKYISIPGIQRCN